MADVEFAPGTGAGNERQAATLGGAVNIAGALVSVALVAGIGVWGYKLMMRDVSGVPVVRALEGPMRVQPAEPGGRPADHQGLAVNAVAAHGEAAKTPDTLVLAPRPVALSDEDVPQPTLPVRVTPASAATAEPVPLSKDALAAFRDGSVDALVDELTRNAEPQPEAATRQAALTPEAPAPADTATGAPAEPAAAAPDAPDAPAAVQPAPVPAVAVDVPGVKRSLRPPRRPAGLARRAAPAVDAAAQAPAVVDVDPDTLAPGTRLAQLGAFESAEIAKSEWDGLAARFADYIEGKSRVIQKASSGGRTFYRLRVMGFDDLADARRFCSTLVAEGADCIPVVTR